MEPILSLDASFRGVSDVIQIQMVPHNGSFYREMRSGGQGVGSFFGTLKVAGVWS